MKTSGNKLLAISTLQNAVFESSSSPGDSQKLEDKFLGSTQQLQSELS
jgi:hypothetical protein